MGVTMLEAVNNKWAIEELKKFAFSDYCNMEIRTDALYALNRMGAVKDNELVRFWRDGEWMEIKVFGTEVTEDVLLDYDPEFLEADSKTHALIMSNKYAEAEKSYLEIIKKWPMIARGYTNLASICLNRDDYKQGRIYMEKAHEIDPQYPFAVCGLAQLEIVEGNFDQAVKILGKMTEIKRIHPEAMALWWFTTAQLNLAKNDIEEAEKQLEEIRKIDTNGNYSDILKKQIDLAKRIK
jgi:tetratricopeptide (TPR) repeat protein